MRIRDWSSDVCSSDLAERLLAIGRTPHLDHLAEVLAVQAHARKGHVLDRDALAVVLGDLAVHLAAVAAFHVGEHRHRVFRLRRRSEEHTSELQSLMRISYAVLCLKKKKQAQ